MQMQMKHKSRNSGREPLSAGTGLPALMMADRKGGAMDYLSVEEAAVLKNCSARYIRKQCKNGALPAVIQEHPQNHKPCYQIPVSAFPEPLQARYYQQKRQEMGVMPTPIPAETKPQKPKKKAKAVRQMTIEDCTAQQRYSPGCVGGVSVVLAGRESANCPSQLSQCDQLDRGFPPGAGGLYPIGAKLSAANRQRCGRGNENSDA